MSWKKIFPTLLLILLVYSWFFFFNKPPEPTPKQLEGQIENLTLFIEPDAGKEPVLNAINSAQQEILLEIYLFSDKDIIESLASSRARGVAVNVLIECHPFGGGNINTKTRKELATYDIKVQCTSPDFSLTHAKVMVIDSQIAFIFTQNLTTTSFTKNREFAIVTTNDQDVIELRNLFLADWNHQDFTPSQTTSLIESPNNSRSVISSLITNATTEINIEMEIVTDDEIVSLLKAKAATSEVKLIIPTLAQIDANEKDARELVQDGVLVRTLSSPYIHAKMILVDNSKAYIGSINFSSQSLDENREIGIILSQSDIISSLQAVFLADWEKAQPVILDR